MNILEGGIKNFQLTTPKMSDIVIYNKVDAKGIILKADGFPILMIFNEDGKFAGMRDFPITDEKTFEELDDSTYVFVDVTLYDVFVTAKIISFYRVDMPVVEYLEIIRGFHQNGFSILYQKLIDESNTKMASQ